MSRPNEGRLVVTGALGHIGSRLIRSLPAGRYTEVLLLDNLSTQRYCSLFDLPTEIPFRFKEADICKEVLEPHLEGAEAVVHLAAITNAAGSFQIQEQVEEVNFRGTQRMAEACRNAGVPLLFLSTTSVYGTQSDVVDEDCPPDELQPQSPYAASKLRAEQMLQGMAEGLDFVVCRFGTIYGASIGMRFHTAVNRFVWSACLGEPLPVWRTALNQKRPYLDLGDAVRAIDFLLSERRFDRRIYNVLTDNASVAEIVDAIREFVPDVRIELVDSAIMNQLSYTVRNERFRALGFEFRGSLREGIERSVALLRSVRFGAAMPQAVDPT